jgi:hypothetical protein
MSAMEHYIERFGLGEGELKQTADGYELHFARDLVWKPAGEVWRMLTEDGLAHNPHVPPGEVTRSEEPRLLEYATDDGLVRWDICYDSELGSRVELIHTAPARLADRVPELLATWHTHLEQLFTATHGVEPGAWPEDRVEQLAKHYRERISS